MIVEERQRLTSLRWQWLVVAVFYTSGIVLGYRFMDEVWPAAAALRWLNFAALLMIVQLAILWWALPANHPAAGGALFGGIGFANVMTLTRGLLICFLAGFLFGPEPLGWLAWAPAAVYTLERIIDFFDGFVARRTRRETRLGAILDIEFDGIGILIAVALAIQYEKMPLWYLILGFGRQLFVLGMWLRQRRGLPVYDLPPSEQRRIIAGLQTGFITVVLWPALSAQVTWLASYLFAIPLICSFGRDWLVVSGVFDANSVGYLRVRQRAKVLIEGWLPLAARILGSGLLFALVWQGASAAGFAGLGATWPGLGVGGVILGLLAAVLMLFGIAGRGAALVLAAVVSLLIQSVGLTWANGLLLTCTIVVLHLGSGRLALWQPEEPFLHTKLGAPAAPEA